MRVALVQPSLAKYRIAVFKELARRPGIDLTLVYGTKPDLENVPAEGFIAIPSPLRSPQIAGQKLMLHGAQWAYATREKADVLVLNWTSRYLTQYPALVRAWWNRVPTVLWGHGFSKKDHWWRRWARRRIARLGTALLFYDDDTAEEFRAMGWPASSIFVAANSLDSSEIIAAREQWGSDPTRLRDFQEKYGLRPGPVLLYVSRLQPENHVDLLIEATEAIARTYPDVRIVIIGNGGIVRESLQQLARDRGVEKNVVFHEGIYNEAMLAPWFLSADLFCYPQNIGLSLLHAFLYGVPVVTSDRRRCHGPEIAAFKDGINGRAFLHGSGESFGKAVLGLLADSEQRQSMSREAMRTVETEYSIEKMVDGMEAAIRFAYDRRSGLGGRKQME